MTPSIEASLPFDSSKHDVVISQGFYGPYSHRRFEGSASRYDLSYALDFALPLGTVVLAARQGIVEWIIEGDGSYYTGVDPKQGRKTMAASVTLAHPEVGGDDVNIYSHYQHLDPRGFLVAEWGSC